jgi:putative addiction module component (TIGR02574 family)
MPTRDEILRDALTLPPADRAFVANGIDQSFAPSGFATSDVAVAWASEVERRLAAYDRGDLEAIPAGVALAKMRERLAAFRARGAEG